MQSKSIKMRNDDDDDDDDEALWRVQFMMKKRLSTWRTSFPKPNQTEQWHFTFSTNFRHLIQFLAALFFHNAYGSLPKNHFSVGNFIRLSEHQKGNSMNASFTESLYREKCKIKQYWGWNGLAFLSLLKMLFRLSLIKFQFISRQHTVLSGEHSTAKVILVEKLLNPIFIGWKCSTYPPQNSFTNPTMNNENRRVRRKWSSWEEKIESNEKCIGNF